LYSAIAVTLFGMETFELETPVIVRSLFFVALAYPLARNALFWPIGELALLYFGACWVVAGYPPNFGWYRLWPGVFASVLAAIAWSEWLMVGWRRWGPSATPVTPTPALS
jgi:Zn-dependent protease